MLGQTMVSPRHKFLLGPRHKFLLAPGSQVMRASMAGCTACGAVGPASPTVDLGDKDILLELKTMMVLHTPDLAHQGEAWFTAPWSAKDWESFKAILAKLPGSATEKAKLVAHQTKAGAVALGMPPAGTVGFPSIYGIAALGDRLVTQGTMTYPSLAVAFPKLSEAGKAAAGGLKPGDPGVTAPSEASSLPLGWIAVGLGVVAIGAYFLLKKK